MEKHFLLYDFCTLGTMFRTEIGTENCFIGLLLMWKTKSKTNIKKQWQKSFTNGNRPQCQNTAECLRLC